VYPAAHAAPHGARSIGLPVLFRARCSRSEAEGRAITTVEARHAGQNERSAAGVREGTTRNNAVLHAGIRDGGRRRFRAEESERDDDGDLQGLGGNLCR